MLGALGPTLRLFGLTPAIAVLDRGLVHVIGLVVALAGILGTVAAQRAMGASRRVGVDPRETTSLVTTGMFAWVCTRPREGREAWRGESCGRATPAREPERG
ncbi:hypothetical protein ACQPZU_11445 [Saccharomonospora azurea]|uniref:Uncharacterized protein n=1 Tax=Saccharomonospora azurea NA-128 TaxID=882081 RepID=H8GA01_9PSEU|nr:hypothetical protein [Saccharomonospora azurea]EHY87557.1 hypothetical protein SacazDRAFT_00606 [Saccharomonospora azurea NA-128]